MKMPGSLSTKCFLAFGLMLMTACGSPNPINVGSTDGGTGGTGGYGGPDDTDACRNGEQLPIVGVWEGYIENFAFPSGSDAIRVAVTSATSAQTCGKVTLGKGPPPPPPTDPDVGYPPGYSTKDPFLNVGFFTIDRTEGFPFSILAGTADAPRFKFGVDWHEFWQSWCALQPPIALEQSAGFGCLGATGGGWSEMGCDVQIGDQHFPLECGKFQLCVMPMCTCTMTNCRVEPIARWPFDLRITGDLAAGSVRTNTEIRNIYLTRTK